MLGLEADVRGTTTRHEEAHILNVMSVSSSLRAGIESPLAFGPSKSDIIGLVVSPSDWATRYIFGRPKARVHVLTAPRTKMTARRGKRMRRVSIASSDSEVKMASQG
jgi:hypothetical protein